MIGGGAILPRFLRAIPEISLAAGLACAAAGRSQTLPPSEPFSTMSWKETLTALLPLYGHRNWIVVADSAYPAQSSPGIETIVSGASPEEVLKQVFHTLAASKHVKPIVYTDLELEFVPEACAPGISAFRAQLKELLQGQICSVLPHVEIIGKLDQAGQTFRVLIIKTELTVPYTSVFLQLDCGYWSAEGERQLRSAMDAACAPAL